MVTGFLDRGWVRFPRDPEVLDWVSHALPAARASVCDPAYGQWLDCEGTWFIGVDALDNDAQGQVGASGPLTGQVVEFIQRHLGMLPLHKAQVSVIYPGYPRPRQGEGEAAARYRARRDGAHVDGLKPDANRRRHVEEPHAWILGLPLTEASADAAPLVVWEGSHRLMQSAFATAFDAKPRDGLDQVDVTDIYQSARRKVFDTCRRIELPARPGEAYLLHRHVLHGVAPWADTAKAGPDGRMIAYFRPDMPGGVAAWSESP